MAEPSLQCASANIQLCLGDLLILPRERTLTSVLSPLAEIGSGRALGDFAVGHRQDPVEEPDHVLVVGRQEAGGSVTCRTLDRIEDAPFASIVWICLRHP